MTKDKKDYKNRQMTACIIPAAGKGTRWQPFSNFIPKEMLPINNTPLIYYTVKEAIEAGCLDIIVIINKDKEIIRQYLSSTDLIDKTNFHFIYQKSLRGLVDTIYLSKDIIGGQNFALLVPDMPALYQKSPLLQAIEVFQKCKTFAHTSAFAPYPKKNNLFYGEFKLEKRVDGFFNVTHLCPKAKSPQQKHHPENNLRGASRFIYTFEIWPLVEECLKQKPYGEVWDGDLIEIAFAKGQKFIGFEAKGRYFDTGVPLGYAKANLEFLKSKFNVKYPAAETAGR